MKIEEHCSSAKRQSKKPGKDPRPFADRRGSPPDHFLIYPKTTEQIKWAVEKYMDAGAHSIEVRPSPHPQGPGWTVTAWTDERVTGLTNQLPLAP